MLRLILLFILGLLLDRVRKCVMTSFNRQTGLPNLLRIIGILSNEVGFSKVSIKRLGFLDMSSIENFRVNTYMGAESLGELYMLVFPIDIVSTGFVTRIDASVYFDRVNEVTGTPHQWSIRS